MSTVNKLRKVFTMNIVDISQALQAMHVIGEVVTSNISTGWVEVGEGNILRIQVASDTYLTFSDDNSGGAVSSTTSPAVKILTGDHYVVCSAKYVRASANPTRVELLKL